MLETGEVNDIKAARYDEEGGTGWDTITKLGWTPGRKARGRPKTTWRRTVEKERSKMGWKSREVSKAVALNMERWSESMMALCAYWRDETE